MRNVYGVSSRNFLAPYSHSRLVSLVTKGADKESIFSGSIGDILREHGPDWMASVLERDDLQLHFNRSISLGETSDVLLGFDVLPSEQPLPESFRRAASWHQVN